MELDNGTRIGSYVVETRLGRGGVAVVYRVRHAALDTSHALKVLASPTVHSRQRLLSEGRIQARLRHPNVVSVTDVLEVGGYPALLLDLVEGPSLAALIEDGALSEVLVNALGAGVLAGVGAAHRAGLVHRDLKPANVLVAVDEGFLVPRVTDFGLARLLDDDEPRHTRTGAALGTPRYMAPEQIRDPRAADARSDVWALGVLLYELAVGEAPFRAADQLELFKAIDEVRYVPLEARRRGLPAAMYEAVDAALQGDPDERPADADALLALWGGAAEPVVADPELRSLLASLTPTWIKTGETPPPDEGATWAAGYGTHHGPHDGPPSEAHTGAWALGDSHEAVGDEATGDDDAAGEGDEAAADEAAREGSGALAPEGATATTITPAAPSPSAETTAPAAPASAPGAAPAPAPPTPRALPEPPPSSLGRAAPWLVSAGLVVVLLAVLLRDTPPPTPTPPPAPSPTVAPAPIVAPAVTPAGPSGRQSAGDVLADRRAALVGRATEALLEADLAEAIDQASYALAGSDDPSPHRITAAAGWASGRRYSALEELGKGTRAENDGEAAHALLDGLLDPARLDRWLADHPDDVVGRAFRLLAGPLGEPDAVAAHLAALERAAPGRPLPLLARARIARLAGRFDEAEAALTRWAALAPESPDLARERAALALARGRPEEVVAIVDPLVEARGASSDLWVLRAGADRRLGREAALALDLERAARLPADAGVRLHLALADAALLGGDREVAFASLAEAFAIADRFAGDVNMAWIRVEVLGETARVAAVLAERARLEEGLASLRGAATAPLPEWARGEAARRLLAVEALLMAARGDEAAARSRLAELEQQGAARSTVALLRGVLDGTAEARIRADLLP